MGKVGIEPTSPRLQGGAKTTSATFPVNLVGMTGIEPARIAPPEPKSGVSTNSTTSPKLIVLLFSVVVIKV